MDSHEQTDLLDMIEKWKFVRDALVSAGECYDKEAGEVAAKLVSNYTLGRMMETGIRVTVDE